MSSAASAPPSGSSRPSRNNTATLVVVVAVVLAVAVGFVVLGQLVGSDDDDAGGPANGFGGTTPTQSTQPTAPPTTPVPSTTPTSPGGGGLSCTEAPAPPADPQQFDSPPDPALAEASTWQVTLQTNCGSIVMELDGKSAPQTVASFLFLSQKGYYDDVPCHRLTTSQLFVLQCGDPTGQGSGDPGYGYGIENAPPTGAYPAGTVAMARTADPNSNGSQFFIVYADTTLPTDGGGYSIFGKVVEGLPIVEAVAEQGLGADGVAPAQPVSILSVDYQKL